MNNRYFAKLEGAENWPFLQNVCHNIQKLKLKYSSWLIFAQHEFPAQPVVSFEESRNLTRGPICGQI